MGSLFAADVWSDSLIRRGGAKSVLSGSLALGLLFSAPATGFEFASVERGVKPERAFQVGQIDDVRLMNGGLLLSIPIGNRYRAGMLEYGLTLHYSSNLWDFSHRETGPPDPPGVYRQAYPVRANNAGFGWRLSLGEFWDNDIPTGPGRCPTCYIAPDGARHKFYDDLHPDVSAPDEAMYTRDGSYLRLRSISGGHEIDFPDGRTHVFDDLGRLVQMRDPYNNAVGILYGANTWTLSDTEGRTHVISFTNVPHYGQAVSSVALTVLGGATATYTFSYAFEDVGRACQDDDPDTLDLIELPLLTAVTLPDTSSYQMPVPASYHLAPGACELGPSIQGLLRQITLPTLGSIEWDHGAYEFPVPIEAVDKEDSPIPGWLRNTAGVVARRLRRADGAVEATWTYTQTLPDGQDSVESITRVQHPSGDVTDHYFNVGEAVGPQYGLSFSPVESAPGRPDLLRSTKVYDCDANGQSCVLKRTTYLKYETSTAVPNTTPEFNPRIVATYVRHHDDSNRFASVDRSDFDGLGNFRSEVTNGNYARNNVRSSFTNFNPDAGTYPGSFVMPEVDDPWILGTYTRRDVSEDLWTLLTHPRRVPEGSDTARIESCFDPETGFLTRTRTIALGTTRNTHDLVSVFEHNLAGQRIDERHYGGDLQAVGTGDLCTLGLPANPVYRTVHTYAFGSLESSRPYSGSTPLEFLRVDRDIDPSTGWITAERDIAGVETEFDYDVMGRLTWSKPELAGDGWTETVYTPASTATSLAKVEILRRGNGSAAEPVLARSSFDFDSFGRLQLESRLDPGNTWRSRETTYDAMGRPATVSEWGALDKVTTTTHDAFGRPLLIVPPDNPDHNMAFSYSGDREVSRRVRVTTAVDIFGTPVETDAFTFEQYDRQGRLIEVLEPSGDGGIHVSTEYAYDVGNRLSQVSTEANVGKVIAVQERNFIYDNRGFLLAEQHPEKGFTGNGVITYQGYDAGGHATRRIDGPNDLTFEWDAAERLVEVKETGGLKRPLKVFTYATANSPTTGRSLGKLLSAERLNHIVLEGSPFTIRVAEGYEYLSRQGRVSERTTTFSVDGAPVLTHTFETGWSHTPLGDIATIVYPSCDGGCKGVGAPRTVGRTYTNGWLSAVTDPGFAPWGSFTYHSNGMLDVITHRNGVAVVHGKDPADMQRPLWITTAGVAGGANWTSDGYGYDGSGNIHRIGESRYLYDSVSRLKSASVRLIQSGGSSEQLIFADGFESGDTSAWMQPGQPTAAAQAFTYDPFGNLIDIAGAPGRSIPVDPQTNRLNGSGTSYDAAGNVTTWNTNTYSYGPFNETWYTDIAGEEYLHIYNADDERFYSRRVKGPGQSRDRMVIRGLDQAVIREFIFNRDLATWEGAQDTIHRGAGQLLAQTGPAGDRHFHLDHLGSPRLITAANGARVAFHAYLPYGEEGTNVTQDTVRFKFTGHERDLGAAVTETDDLDYMHARYGSPVLGRFLSVDPVSGIARTPQSWNRYTYAIGNPVKYVDPDGRFWGLALRLARIAGKGGDLALTVQGIREDINTVISPTSSAVDKGIAVVSLVSEVVSPVSLKDGKVVAKALGASDKVESGKLVYRGGSRTQTTSRHVPVWILAASRRSTVSRRPRHLEARLK